MPAQHHPPQASRGLSLRLAGALALLPALLACGGGPERKNAVLITVDTLRADHTSLHGYERETTPELEAWAARGTTFDWAWSTCSWTTPSMCMLLTGRARSRNQGTIFPGEHPLGEVLKGSGYETAGVVANALLREDKGFTRGFDHYSIYVPERGARGVNSWNAEEVTRQGLVWLERAPEPFFLFLHYFDPHDPYRPSYGLAFPPEKSAERQAAFLSALPEEHRERFTHDVYRGIEQRIALYDSEVREVDASLATLRQRLEESGLAERTVVALTADHGEGLWQRAATPGEGFKDNAFFPELYFEHGVQLYSEQVHVPLVFVGPGVPAGVRRDEFVSLLDVVPTLLGLLDIEVLHRVDGLDLFGGELPPGRDIYSMCSRGTTVTVDERWRLHEPAEYRVKRDGAQPELYDLESDPLELDPLEDPERLASLRAQLDDWRARHAREGEEKARSAEQLAEDAELMSALGYAGEDLEPEVEPREEAEDLHGGSEAGP